MRHSTAVSTLFKERILLPPESVSNTLLGYLFFREKLIEMILGDSEVNILYWVGKELGNSMQVKVVEEVEDVFLQLDLGVVHIEQHSTSIVSFRISHTRFNLISKNRLAGTLNLETGLIAGIMEKVTGTYCAATLTLKEKDGTTFACIDVAVDHGNTL